MSDIAIRVENLKKLYVLKPGVRGSKHDGIRHLIQQKATAPFRKAKALLTSRESAVATPAEKHKEFWAINDLSFDIHHGEVVGIIGRNGAGKSTLLKLLSRITSPTAGRIGIRGRIASLLEVGTGFHPELTGRENIYLNGAILGMKRHEVQQKFDEIVEFSGVSDFLSTPVKRYSSGMYVRLAFAVAAHLEPEILIIDEVLAVGDAEFQKKCLGKMKDVANAGRTVLFVSHNMGMVTTLCDRALVLQNGKLISDGPASDSVIHYYTHGKHSPNHIRYDAEDKAPCGGDVTLLECAMEDLRGQSLGKFDMSDTFRAKVTYRLDRDFSKAPYPSLHLKDSSGNYVFVSSPPGIAQHAATAGVYETSCEIPGGLLNNGTYFMGISMTTTDRGQQLAFHEQDLLCFNIKEDLDARLDQERNGFSGTLPGVIRPDLSWKISKV